MNESFVQSNPENNTPESKLLLTVFTELFTYFRAGLLIPMIVLYGAAVSIVLITLLSFLSPQLSLLDLPFGNLLPYFWSGSLELNNNSLVQIWGVVALILYALQRIIELVTHKKLSLSYFRKIGLQLLILTVMYAFIVGAAYTHAGWFGKGDDLTFIMALFYITTLVVTIVSWMILAPMDMMLFFMRRAQLSQEEQQQPIELPWKKGGLTEKILVKMLEHMMGQLPSNRNQQ